MRTERVTVSLPVELLAAARDAVDRGTADSLDAYVAESMAARRMRERSLAVLADLYGGPPPPDELAQARRSLLPGAAV
jgi:antitoxin ParD1/3/4